MIWIIACGHHSFSRTGPNGWVAKKYRLALRPVLHAAHHEPSACTCGSVYYRRTPQNGPTTLPLTRASTVAILLLSCLCTYVYSFQAGLDNPSRWLHSSSETSTPSSDRSATAKHGPHNSFIWPSRWPAKVSWWYRAKCVLLARFLHTKHFPRCRLNTRGLIRRHRLLAK